MGHTIPPHQHAAYWLNRLRKRLADDEGLAGDTVDSHICVARVFLRYLAERNIPLKAVTPTDLEQYLSRQRRAFRFRHGESPHDLKHWRSYYTAPIHHLLRVAQGSWPPLRGFEAHIEKLRVMRCRRDVMEVSFAKWNVLRAASPCFRTGAFTRRGWSLNLSEMQRELMRGRATGSREAG